MSRQSTTATSAAPTPYASPSPARSRTTETSSTPACSAGSGADGPLTRADTRTLAWGHPSRGGPVGAVVMYCSVSVDGFIADANDQPGPLFDWLMSGDVPLDESGVLKVS